MSDFVLDASVALAWILDEPQLPYASRVRKRMRAGARALVPPHWHLEIGNALLTGLRRGRLIPADLDPALQDIADLTSFIDTDDQPDNIAALAVLGRDRSLTAYDASYVRLALRFDLPLATEDKAMVAAARAMGISLFT